ncbi:single-stranded DNA-binding protein [Xanthomonas citri]|uniref:single-stranded DNA-binding protein n=1 Tax=Xanthomonas citri TaxID=346 RepID=UPI0001CECB80|nr:MULTISPECIES: single-stranded DNA-binding protein [Xanthomonas]EFF42056.1 single-strand binding protein [Xanthomonas citri pv. aurantifolii str. ICPB 11122]RTE56197.1 single-stranded DNA-binding protein [Xanthomonas axonopodis pv. eucalyptorum]RWU13118.1 single-stranded DNA-binding protein [Xanthomonas phaseoli pv. manihotis str. CIO151]UZB06151.1 single-stranded DNA-binding protein [Xanthomonas citri pv. fuscans]
MQSNVFVGNLAKNPTLSGNGDRAYCRFTLISNEYAGRDGEGAARERTVTLSFVAFKSMADRIARNCMKGDQLIVEHRIANNNREVDSETIYGFDFIAERVQFGAPGKEKREHLAENQGSND